MKWRNNDIMIENITKNTPIFPEYSFELWEKVTGMKEWR